MLFFLHPSQGGKLICCGMGCYCYFVFYCNCYCCYFAAEPGKKTNLRWHGDFLFVVISIILKLSWGKELTLAWGCYCYCQCYCYCCSFEAKLGMGTYFGMRMLLLLLLSMLLLLLFFWSQAGDRNLLWHEDVIVIVVILKLSWGRELICCGMGMSHGSGRPICSLPQRFCKYLADFFCKYLADLFANIRLIFFCKYIDIDKIQCN